MNLLRQIEVFDTGFATDTSAQLSILDERMAAAQERLDREMIESQASVDFEIDPKLKAVLEASLAETAKLLIQIGRKLPGDSR